MDLYSTMSANPLEIGHIISNILVPLIGHAVGALVTHYLGKHSNRSRNLLSKQAFHVINPAICASSWKGRSEMWIVCWHFAGFSREFAGFSRGLSRSRLAPKLPLGCRAQFMTPKVLLGNRCFAFACISCICLFLLAGWWVGNGGRWGFLPI
jgi:hypothetical protein